MSRVKNVVFSWTSPGGLYSLSFSMNKNDKKQKMQFQSNSLHFFVFSEGLKIYNDETKSKLYLVQRYTDSNDCFLHCLFHDIMLSVFDRDDNFSIACFWSSFSLLYRLSVELILIA